MEDYQVYNSGYPGDTTVELLARFERDVAAHNPDAVILLAGSNDMFYPGHMLPLETYRNNLEKLISKIEQIDAVCVLMTAPHFIHDLLLENFPDTLQNPIPLAERLEQLNDTIRQVAVQKCIRVVDVCKLITPVDFSAGSLVLNPLNSNKRDGMHMTAAGYKVIAENAGRLLRKYYPEAKIVVCFGDSITYGVYMPGKGTAAIDALTYPGQLCKYLNG